MRCPEIASGSWPFFLERESLTATQTLLNQNTKWNNVVLLGKFHLEICKYTQNLLLQFWSSKQSMLNNIYHLINIPRVRCMWHVLSKLGLINIFIRSFFFSRPSGKYQFSHYLGHKRHTLTCKVDRDWHCSHNRTPGLWRDSDVVSSKLLLSVVNIKRPPKSTRKNLEFFPWMDDGRGRCFIWFNHYAIQARGSSNLTTWKAESEQWISAKPNTISANIQINIYLNETEHTLSADIITPHNIK